MSNIDISKLGELQQNDKNLTTSEDHYLESASDRRERWASIRIMYFTMFLMSLGFSVVLTGVWPYLRKLDKTASKDFMGFVVAAHPFSQMLFSPLVGWWGNKLGKIRIPLMVTIVIFIIASTIYSIIEIFDSYRKYWILFARLLVGVSAANMAVCRSYISAATKFDERTRVVAILSLAQLLGFIVGPGLQAAVTPLGDDGYRISSSAVSLNMYTAAGWINVFLGVVNFILVLPVFFQERSIAAREAMLLSSSSTEKEAWKKVEPDYLSAWTLIVAFFILTFNFVLLESLGTPLTMDQFAWTNKEALSYLGIMLSVGGLIACFTSALINRISRRFGELPTLLWGSFLLMVLGRIAYIPWGSEPPLIAYQDEDNCTMTNSTNDISCSLSLGCPVSQTWCLTTPAMTISQLIFGFILTSIGYPIGITLIQTIFSKVLGPRPQGVWMGLITGSGCLSRVIGPVFVVYVYTHFGTIWTFGGTALMMAISMIWLKLVSNRVEIACNTAHNLRDHPAQAQEIRPMADT
ncbi:hypothetical protein O3M35_003172 [Rhynocoris fuscipes]|uniref:Major facilitator superfamily (MFS) profile domain-containing protein n=1 Tax=Rhynocoris fuscipes TaxID=488301 RepID=A0AAW1CJ86_9HEMI